MIYWILIADASRARVFSTRGRRDPFRLERELLNPAGRARPQEILSDAPGRYSEQGRAGSIRSAMEFRTPIHEVEEQRFARQLAELLDKALVHHAFDALAIFAAPQMLGLLREDISPEVRKRLVASLAKDFTTLKDDQLSEHLWAALPPTALAQQS